MKFQNGQIKIKNDAITVQDADIIVHELAHTFDLQLNHIYDKNGKEIKNNSNNNLLTECTAIAFENLFFKYLYEKNIISGYKDIEKIIRNRNNNTYSHCETSYCCLKMADLMKKNKSITEKDVKKILNELKDMYPIEKKGVIDVIAKGGVSRFNNCIKYAISGMISPTIEKNIIEGNIKKVKEYIKFSQEANFEKALDALEISLDEKGVEKLKNNKEELLREVKRKETEEIEK